MTISRGPWNFIECTDCQHLVISHEERKDGNNRLCEEGFRYNQCECENTKAEIIFNYFEKRISDLENRITT